MRLSSDQKCSIFNTIEAFTKHPTAATADTVRKIRNMVELVSLPLEREAEANCVVPLGTVNRIIVEILKAKGREKMPCS